MSSLATLTRWLPVLYEDAHLVAVVKPAGIDLGGGPKDVRPTLVDLLARLRDVTGELRPVNRLTRYESGIVLFARTAAAAVAMRERLRAGSVSQVWHAVAVGRAGKPRLTLEAGHGASRGRGKPARKPRPAEAGPARAQTTVERLRAGEKRVLIRCRTNAENTHVLRAQLRAAGLPVLGDTLARAPRPGRPLRISVEDMSLHLAEVSFMHPPARRRVELTCEPPAEMQDVLDGASYLQRRLEAALLRRADVLLANGTDCCRLLIGDAEGLPLINAERFGPAVVLYVLDESRVPLGLQQHLARWYRGALHARAVYVKSGAKDRSATAQSAERETEGPVLGEPVVEELPVRENGLTYLVRLHEGPAVGLYLDQRENRARVRDLARGKDVLNLFAYTCGFSVAAAAGGAASTVSVDISVRHLEWGKRNFAANDLSLENHTFIKSTAAEYFPRARRQGRSFDLIVLDPPTFAHGRRGKETFQITRDLAALVVEALTVLRSGGLMLVTTNYRKATGRWMDEQVAAAGKAAKRQHRVTARPLLPPDFAPDPDHAKSILVRFD